MDQTLETIFKRIPHQPQRQDSTSYQARCLVIFLQKLGLALAAETSVRFTADIGPRSPEELPDYLREQLETFDQQKPSTDDEYRQILNARSFANRLGLYDAADSLRHVTEALQS